MNHIIATERELEERQGSGSYSGVDVVLLVPVDIAVARDVRESDSGRAENLWVADGPEETRDIAPCGGAAPMVGELTLSPISWGATSRTIWRAVWLRSFMPTTVASLGRRVEVAPDHAASWPGAGSSHGCGRRIVPELPRNDLHRLGPRGRALALKVTERYDRRVSDPSAPSFVDHSISPIMRSTRRGSTMIPTSGAGSRASRAARKFPFDPSCSI